MDTTAEIIDIKTPENNRIVTFQVDRQWIKYIFPKGYLAINGASLTVVDVDRNRGTFSVSFIPETLRLTTFAQKEVGDRVNIEIERQAQVMVDTIQDFMASGVGKLPDQLKGLLPET